MATAPGITSPTAAVGLFMNRQMGVLCRVGAVQLLGLEGRKSFLLASVTAQYWWSDRLVLGLGPVLALYGKGIEPGHDVEPRTGLGVSASVGYSFMQIDRHTFRIESDMVPTGAKSITVVGSMLRLVWQWI